MTACSNSARQKAGETVLVRAGGGVGRRVGVQNAPAQPSRHRIPLRLDRLKGFGMDHSINYAPTTSWRPHADHPEAGVNLVVDSVGGRSKGASPRSATAGA
jgi:NADPH:quinone reductase-like Zn-dependent oxidoreductase